MPLSSVEEVLFVFWQILRWQEGAPWGGKAWEGGGNGRRRWRGAARFGRGRPRGPRPRRPALAAGCAALLHLRAQSRPGRSGGGSGPANGACPPTHGASREGAPGRAGRRVGVGGRSEEHTSELQSRENLVC